MNSPITLERLHDIIEQNKKYLSLYRGKFVAFNIRTGELIRWDNTQVELLKRIHAWEPKPDNFFVYGVPLIISNDDVT